MATPKSTSKKLTYLHKILIAVIGVALFSGGYYGVQELRAHLAIGKIESLIKDGFPAVAADHADHHKYRLTKTEAGCKALLEAYYGSHQLEKLEWASQSCIYSGQKISQAYLGLAVGASARGQDIEALRILYAVVPKFKDSPDVFYRIAQLLSKLKKSDEAANAYVRASSLAPDSATLGLEALQYLAGLEKWKEAAPIAGRIKSAKTEDPSVKLLIARVLAKSGDKASAQAEVEEARTLMKKDPGAEAALKKEFGDVLRL